MTSADVSRPRHVSIPNDAGHEASDPVEIADFVRLPGQRAHDPHGARTSALRKVLFIQATEAAGYPPIINAAMLMAERGWRVTVFTAPIAGKPFVFPAHEHIEVKRFRERPSHVMSKGDYLKYCVQATRLAMKLKPDVVYASDHLVAAPALLVATMLGARIVYHEHDRPWAPARPTPIQRLLWAARSKLARSAHLCIIPQEERLHSFLAETGRRGASMCVWNCPRTEEVGPPRAPIAIDEPISFYYHGSINSQRLPLTVVEALARASSTATLTIVGYESPGSSGYLAAILQRAAALDLGNRVRLVGPLPRADIFAAAARARVGLVFMPRASGDMNMEHMAGASNKAFDYLAVGEMLLVSDLPSWRDMFVLPGYALACDPENVEDLVRAMRWCADNPETVFAMGEQGRRRIAKDWNYERRFDGVLRALDVER